MAEQNSIDKKEKILEMLEQAKDLIREPIKPIKFRFFVPDFLEKDARQFVIDERIDCDVIVI